MYFLFTLVALLVSAGLSSAQTIDPSSVDNSTKIQWCNAQTSSCPLICAQTTNGNTATAANSCDPTTLVYSCICSNNLSPNSSQYTQTIPYFECTEYETQCVNACPSTDSTCQSNCRTTTPCVAQDPPKGNGTLASSSSAAGTAGATGTSAGSATQTFNGFAGASSSAAAKSEATMTGNQFVGSAWTAGVVMAGLAVGAGAFL